MFTVVSADSANADQQARVSDELLAVDGPRLALVGKDCEGLAASDPASSELLTRRNRIAQEFQTASERIADES